MNTSPNLRPRALSRSDESIPYNGDLGGVLSNAQGESTLSWNFVARKMVLSVLTETFEKYE